MFGRSSEIFGTFRVVFGNLRKASYGLRKSSEGFARSSAVFEIRRLASGSLRFNFGYLRCNLHSCFTFLHCVTLFCTVLTKNALLFSQSEPSNFFKCIIRGNKATLGCPTNMHLYQYFYYSMAIKECGVLKCAAVGSKLFIVTFDITAASTKQYFYARITWAIKTRNRFAKFYPSLNRKLRVDTFHTVLAEIVSSLRKEKE